MPLHMTYFLLGPQHVQGGLRGHGNWGANALSAGVLMRLEVWEGGQEEIFCHVQANFTNSSLHRNFPEPVGATESTLDEFKLAINEAKRKGLK